jgi:hypothetical protein
VEPKLFASATAPATASTRKYDFSTKKLNAFLFKKITNLINKVIAFKGFLTLVSCFTN